MKIEIERFSAHGGCLYNEISMTVSVKFFNRLSGRFLFNNFFQQFFFFISFDLGLFTNKILLGNDKWIKKKGIKGNDGFFSKNNFFYIRHIQTLLGVDFILILRCLSNR